MCQTIIFTKVLAGFGTQISFASVYKENVKLFYYCKREEKMKLTGNLLFFCKKPGIFVRFIFNLFSFVVTTSNKTQQLLKTALPFKFLFQKHRIFFSQAKYLFLFSWNISA